VILHHSSSSEPATITKMLHTLSKTGEVVKKNPRALTKSQTCVVEIRTQRPICVERFGDFKELGRVLLRRGNESVAAGVVVEVLEFLRGGSA
ncbi:HBS1-like protein, partial [Rhizophlyctis rosea]